MAPATAVYQLLGYPGSGKRTVASALVRHLEAAGRPARLLDNHRTSDIVWDLVPPERRFDDEVMARLGALRAVVLDVAEHLTPPDWSIVLTNFLPPGRPPTVIDAHRRLAEARGCRLVAVVLECGRDERMRRLVDPGRTGHKLVDPEVAARVFDAPQTLPLWPELTRLDNTKLAPEEAAAEIARR